MTQMVPPISDSLRNTKTSRPRAGGKAGGVTLAGSALPTTPQWDSNVDDDDSYPDNWSDGNHIWDHNGTGTRIFPGTNIPNTTNRTNTTPPQKKLSNKNRREQARKERKKRSDERKKNRTPPSDSDDSTILVKNMEILKI
uniref:Uncharacterized protein n=1 Tax=Ciona savignyi TaxID=51511 RepID=H2ZFJ1_CIOSA